jgi:hypothetical protein
MMKYMACVHGKFYVKVIKIAATLDMVMEENSDLMGEGAMFLGYRRFNGPQCLHLQNSKFHHLSCV